MSNDINLPYNFEPRFYQLPALDALDSDYKRVILKWHRRSGKDKCLVNFCAKYMYTHVGTCWYFLPTFAQAKKVIWNNIDSDGFKFMDHFPKSVVSKKNDTEMKIELTNGSIFQLMGSDNIDSARGGNPILIVFSEYAFQNPSVWNVVRPILMANKGIAVFVSTPNGKNHFHDMWENAQNNPLWFTQKLTIDDTKFITTEDIEEERRSGMNEDMIQQEYYVSFDVGVLGSYYSEQLQLTIKEERICKMFPSPYLPVYTSHDLGVNDTNAIWFWQRYGKEIHIIDHYENSNVGLDHYIKVLKDKGYNYAGHYFPHDIKVREYTTGKSRLDTLKELLDNVIGSGESDKVTVLPAMNVNDGIALVRKTFPRMWFDEERCKLGLRCLQEYRKEFDDTKKVYRDKPLHNWSSNSSDAIRYLAMAIDTEDTGVKDNNKPSFTPAGRNANTLLGRK